MVGIKEAVAKAIEYANEVLGGTRITGVLVEEVRSDVVKGNDAWLITVSIPKAPSAFSPAASISAAFSSVDQRDYKTVVVDKDLGAFIELTIRPTPASRQ